MKTKVRIIEQQPQGKYRHLIIEILDGKYKRLDGSTELETIGHLTFLSVYENNEWSEYFGLKFKCETDKPEHLLKMAKLAAHIKAATYYSSTPQEILKVIGAEEYFYEWSNFIPVSYVGMRFYKIMRTKETKEEFYTILIAANDILAEKQFNKITAQNPALSLKLEFNHVIQLPADIKYRSFNPNAAPAKAEA